MAMPADDADGAARVRTIASLRGQLLIGILLPVALLVGLNTVSLYAQALRAADTAYDRTLLASAKTIGEQLTVEQRDGRARLVATVPYSALEAFEADNRSQLFYRVGGFHGELVSGYDDLPRWQGHIPRQGPYAALVDFIDARYRGEPVRMAVLLQPVAGQGGVGVATIQVAETLELRHTLARQMLLDTLWRQALLLAVIGAVVIWVVQRTTRPVRRISRHLADRAENDLAPLDVAAAPRELQPLLEATNELMGRLAHLLAHQKRFVRDASHQLRTPLAVLKAQVQSARRGDLPPAQALAEIALTVDRATRLANQLLALAKVEQLRHQPDGGPRPWAEDVRAVALDLAALIADRELDFELDIAADAAGACVQAHEWALRELVRNLLHNAIRHTPVGGGLRVSLSRHLTSDGARLRLCIADDGPGIDPALGPRLFQPFGAAASPGGSGLGLAIVHEIVQTLGGRLSLCNRGHAVGTDAAPSWPVTGGPPGPRPAGPAHTTGLDAEVLLPIVDNGAP
ncbi:MAG: hypothetical protein RIQ53_1690 [Pseudomonadota bacterium]|jgi:two-component system sensor histidine kinase TctE